MVLNIEEITKFCSQCRKYRNEITTKVSEPFFTFGEKFQVDYLSLRSANFCKSYAKFITMATS